MSVSVAARHASTDPVIEAYDEMGFNYRMTDLQAAVGLVQTGRLTEMIGRRRQQALEYQTGLDEIEGLQITGDPPYGTTNYQSFWVILPDDFPLGRNELMRALAERGVSSRRGIMAAHLEPAFAGHPAAPLPATERITRQSLLLPMFHEMTPSDQERVIGSIREASGLGG
jgi:perosamine synthetase